MKLAIIEKDRHKVLGTLDKHGDCTTLNFLANTSKQYEKSANGFPALFSLYAESGRQNLTSSNFHEANRQAGIWEFIKGRLRVFCFIDEDNNLVILTHGAIKKQQKADKKEIAAAVKIKREYLAARQKGTVEVTPLI